MIHSHVSSPCAEHAYSAWLAEAHALAHRPAEDGGSPHPYVRVGALILDSGGTLLASSSNRFADGLSLAHPERLEHGYKSLWMNCAEQLALACAARQGHTIEGAILCVTLDPCAVCAGMIVESGIRRVVLPDNARAHFPLLKPKWFASLDVGMMKLIESGVVVRRVALRLSPDDGAKARTPTT